MKTFLDFYNEFVAGGMAGDDAAKAAQLAHAEQGKPAEPAAAAAPAEPPTEPTHPLQAATDGVHAAHLAGPLKPFAVLMAEMSALGHSGDVAASAARQSWLLHPEVIAANKA